MIDNEAGRYIAGSFDFIEVISEINLSGFPEKPAVSVSFANGDLTYFIPRTDPGGLTVIISKRFSYFSPLVLLPTNPNDFDRFLARQWTPHPPGAQQADTGQATTQSTPTPEPARLPFIESVIGTWVCLPETCSPTARERCRITFERVSWGGNSWGVTFSDLSGNFNGTARNFDVPSNGVFLGGAFRHFDELLSLTLNNERRGDFRPFISRVNTQSMTMITNAQGFEKLFERVAEQNIINPATAIVDTWICVDIACRDRSYLCNITFRSNGTFSGPGSLGSTVTGSYRISGSNIVLTPDRGLATTKSFFFSSEDTFSIDGTFNNRISLMRESVYVEMMIERAAETQREREEIRAQDAENARRRDEETIQRASADIIGTWRINTFQTEQTAFNHYERIHMDNNANRSLRAGLTEGLGGLGEGFDEDDFSFDVGDAIGGFFSGFITGGSQAYEAGLEQARSLINRDTQAFMQSVPTTIEFRSDGTYSITINDRTTAHRWNVEIGTSRAREAVIRGTNDFRLQGANTLRVNWRGIDIFLTKN
jgi:hypothetical protein